MHREGETARPLSECRLAKGWAIFGLAAAAIMLSFGQLPGMAACRASDAIIRFEFANSGAEVASQINNPACAQGQYYGLWWDTLLFIPAYLCFLVLALLTLRGPHRRLASVGIAMVVIGAFADQIEGTRLFAILAAMPGEPEHFAVLYWAVRIKFALLAAVTFLLAGLLAVRAKVHWPAALIIAVGSVLSFAGVALQDLGWLHLGGLLSWLPLIVTAQFIAWRKPA